MKKYILILSFVLISFISPCQTLLEDYSSFKPCSECFDQWKTTNGETGANNSPSRKSVPKQKTSEAARQTKNFVRGIVMPIIGIFTAAISYVIYRKVTDATNGI